MWTNSHCKRARDRAVHAFFAEFSEGVRIGFVHVFAETFVDMFVDTFVDAFVDTFAAGSGAIHRLVRRCKLILKPFCFHL